MKWLDWLKEKLKFDVKNKNTTNLIILLCVGITFLIAAKFFSDISGPIKNNDEPSSTNIVQQTNSESINKINYVKELENQLSNILGKINDAGKVSVMITLKSSSEVVPAKDETISDKVTNEKDTDGGTRVINESNTNDKVVFQNEQGGNSKPLIVKELNPEIKGVIIVAEGAKNSHVKLQISQAVQTVLDIPAFRVTVYPANSHSSN